MVHSMPRRQPSGLLGTPAACATVRTFATGPACFLAGLLDVAFTVRLGAALLTGLA